ncbi:hypothetical protein R1flu_026494 [Riccia fluitans]|uniref:Uncharacterized protein n=1 Tax=Riccia fluitans TaxID=41844 RepID=A0ABD1XJ11_9MARC
MVSVCCIPSDEQLRVSASGRISAIPYGGRGRGIKATGASPQSWLPRRSRPASDGLAQGQTLALPVRLSIAAAGGTSLDTSVDEEFCPMGNL